MPRVAVRRDVRMSMLEMDRSWSMLKIRERKKSRGGARRSEKSE